MKDLTQGSIGRHLASMAAFIGAGLVFQAAYFIVDLYFVSRLGASAVAGVSSAGNFMFLALAGAQLVSVGALSLISQAIGRRDEPYANLVFNQVGGLGLIFGLVTVVVGYAFAAPACGALAADAMSAGFGTAYLYGYIPSLAGMFLGNAMAAGMRAQGVVLPTMLLSSASVLLNALLAPVLILGWGTGHPLGTFGAGLASSIASLAALVGFFIMLPLVQTRLRVVVDLVRPRLAVWGALMKVGAPAAGEFFLMFFITAVVYVCIRRYGADAQAGYGIGSRVVQALFLPTMAVAFAASPIAGQNFGARRFDRVVQSFQISLGTACAIMAGLTLLCQVAPAALPAFFTSDPAVLTASSQFLRIMSWNFVSSGIVFAASGMFQALGDTRPSFLCSASRLFTYVLPAIWLAGRPGTPLVTFWYLSLVSNTLQMALSLFLLRRTFRQRMPSANAVLPAEIAPDIATDLAQAGAVP